MNFSVIALVVMSLAVLAVKRKRGIDEYSLTNSSGDEGVSVSAAAQSLHRSDLDAFLDDNVMDSTAPGAFLEDSDMQLLNAWAGAGGQFIIDDPAALEDSGAEPHPNASASDGGHRLALTDAAPPKAAPAPLLDSLNAKEFAKQGFGWHPPTGTAAPAKVAAARAKKRPRPTSKCRCCMVSKRLLLEQSARAYHTRALWEAIAFLRAQLRVALHNRDVISLRQHLNALHVRVEQLDEHLLQA